jgi:hypothetical protein
MIYRPPTDLDDQFKMKWKQQQTIEGRLKLHIDDHQPSKGKSPYVTIEGNVGVAIIHPIVAIVISQWMLVSIRILVLHTMVDHSH